MPSEVKNHTKASGIIRADKTAPRAICDFDCQQNHAKPAHNSQSHVVNTERPHTGII
jgi:hypothetical protein